MDDLDKTLDALRIQIKKEIVDHYFAERVYLEEEVKDFQDEVAAYQTELSAVARHYYMLYEVLHREPLIAAVMELLGLEIWPFYQEYRRLPAAVREGLLQGRPPRGLTAWRRYRRLVFEVYEELQRQVQRLLEKHHKITIHLRLLNEDVDKFNSSFDFGLIAAQIEAMEGGAPVISGGLQSGEREELSTRMRFKRQKLSDTEITPPPPLPLLQTIKKPLSAILARHYQGSPQIRALSAALDNDHT